MTSHTPGPWQWYWRVSDDGLGHADCGVFHEKREGHAYSVCRAPRYVTRPEWEDNARLIAAAPDLLAALKQIVQGDIGGTYSGSQCVEIARAAIAKAEGHE